MNIELLTWGCDHGATSPHHFLQDEHRDEWRLCSGTRVVSGDPEWLCRHNYDCQSDDPCKLAPPNVAKCGWVLSIEGADPRNPIRLHRRIMDGLTDEQWADRDFMGALAEALDALGERSDARRVKLPDPVKLSR